jgi:predicted nucleic acid-binding protein
MSRPLVEFDGPALYLDTMVLFTYLRGNDPLLQDFFARIRTGGFSAYTSVLTFDELTYRLVLALIREQYGGSPLTHLRNDEAKLVTEFYHPWLRVWRACEPSRIST